MNRLHRILGLGVLGLTACLQGTEGDQGTFVFYDQTPRPEQAWPADFDRPVDRPLAVGALLPLRVTWNGYEFAPAEVLTDPPEVLELVSITDNGCLLRGLSPGEATVTVRSSTGREDRLSIAVRRADGDRVRLRPWNTYPLPGAYFQDGLAILVGATSHLFGEMTAGDQVLTGYGAHRFLTLPDEDADPAIEGTPREGSDFLDLKARKVGYTHFSFGHSEEVLVRGVTEAEIQGASLLEAWKVQGGSSWVCQVGDLLFPSVLPLDDEGRLVTGTSADPGPVLEIDPDSQGLIEDQTPGDLSQEWKEVFQNRTVFLKCLAEGTATGQVAWRQFRLPFTVQVMPKTP
ncbi:MAG TPA: hypothetical protein PLK60_08555 [Myxococcota bacterium]|nr:hypothetical protein [Myxococcota bacterium]